ncbi:MAG: MmcQ/YjbR family DNA-binding protein [Bacteroidota bacterium]|nr:MmcQ/YjbR family DNA-binding protein [Bacteroidota bacterium]
MTLNEARTLALKFEEAIEASHFEKASFRVNKKIFLTLDEKNKQACIPLSEADQDVFHRMNPDTIFPIPNKWGKQGWTFLRLSGVTKTLFRDALTCAYCKVAPKRLSEKYQNARGEE